MQVCLECMTASFDGIFEGSNGVLWMSLLVPAMCNCLRQLDCKLAAWQLQIIACLPLMRQGYQVPLDIPYYLTKLGCSISSFPVMIERLEASMIRERGFKLMIEQLAGQLYPYPMPSRRPTKCYPFDRIERFSHLYQLHFEVQVFV
jgi:hypothetical protein